MLSVCVMRVALLTRHAGQRDAAKSQAARARSCWTYERVVERVLLKHQFQSCSVRQVKCGVDGRVVAGGYSVNAAANVSLLASEHRK